MRTRPLPRGQRGQAGFSMIEVLIALLVLAFGLLGLALMQTLNLRYTQNAQQRTLAVNLANEMLDTMRANRSQLAQYEMAEADFADIDARLGCTTYNAATATNNILRWQCEVKEALGPQAYAVVDTSGAPAVEVTVVWPELDSQDRDEGEITLVSTL